MQLLCFLLTALRKSIPGVEPCAYTWTHGRANTNPALHTHEDAHTHTHPHREATCGSTKLNEENPTYAPAMGWLLIPSSPSDRFCFPQTADRW